MSFMLGAVLADDVRTSFAIRERVAHVFAAGSARRAVGLVPRLSVRYGFAAFGVSLATSFTTSHA